MSVRRTGEVQKQLEEMPREVFIQYQAIKSGQYGKERRNKLLSLMEQGLIITVNQKHSPQTNEDEDIMYLVKKGKAEIVTSYSYYFSQRIKNFKRTYVRLKK